MRYLLIALAMVSAACSTPQTCEQLGNCPKDAGLKPDTGGALEPFEIKVLDPDAPGGSMAQLSLAIGAGDKIGVTYFAESTAPDGGVARELRYVENAASPQPEVVATVVRTYGTALAYDPAGKPYVAYLGPPGNQGTYWYEGSAVVATRSGATWTSAVAANVFDQVVGLWPALAVDQASGTVFVAGRDIGYGQFAVQGAEKTNIRVAESTNGTSWTPAPTPTNPAVMGFCPTPPPAGCVDQTEGHGGYNQMVVPSDGRPYLVWTGLGPNEFGPATGIYSTRRNADGTWPGNVLKIRSTSNLGNGPSLAHKTGAGFLVSYFESNQIKLLESPDGVDWNKAPDIVVGAGTLDKTNATAWTNEGYPAVVYYECSQRNGVVPPCPKAEDELMLAWRVEGDVWQRSKVDHDGGHFMKLAYLSDGRAVIAYKDVEDRTVKLAIQR